MNSQHERDESPQDRLLGRPPAAPPAGIAGARSRSGRDRYHQSRALGRSFRGRNRFTLLAALHIGAAQTAPRARDRQFAARRHGRPAATADSTRARDRRHEPRHRAGDSHRCARDLPRKTSSSSRVRSAPLRRLHGVRRKSRGARDAKHRSARCTPISPSHFPGAFRDSIGRAAAVANREGALVALGVIPTRRSLRSDISALVTR